MSYTKPPKWAIPTSIRRASPCYNNGEPCPDRHQNCHADCAKYSDWKKAVQDYRAAAYKARNAEFIVADTQIKACIDTREGRRRNRRDK